ncbi:phosphotransferase [Leucobacter sp. CSA2]|uniref:Phosphotransferase n=1 Tax=Leucobacter edaphi TaxID=2796472 RepID=A0A934QC31_9MICO|nr:phosphotransferase [Leucobacter edaphi]MBK0421006.1 phosphotransferase [Leucobacter edaphi]
MASIPFTLAALATSAVPGLSVFGVRAHDDDSFVAAVIVGDDGELLVRVPRSQPAEVLQSAELLGLAALTAGPRSRLPFRVPAALGMTRAGDTRAVVTTLLPGELFETADLTEDALLIEPIAEMLAAIHTLPHTVASEGGLPQRTAQDLRLAATRIIDRAEATRLVPETVLRRWTRVVETAELWDFEPTMVHGSLDAEQLRVDDGQIVGVIGWSELSVGDPASDLAWLLTAGTEVLESVLARYSRARNVGSISSLRTRAALYYELEVARWLLHGTESHDQSVVDDAVSMLDRLVGRPGILGDTLGAQDARVPLDEDEVSALLDETPEVNDLLSETAAYEALDEDRMFGMDTDFIEPLPEDDRGAGAGAHAGKREAELTAGPSAAGVGEADGAESPDAAADAAAEEEPAGERNEDEHLTEPIDPKDLPRD